MMMRLFLFMLLLAGFAACQPEPSQQPTEATANGLKKLRNPTEEQIRQLREAGAEIIVQEPGYIIVRTDNVTQELTAFNFEAISEKDLVQRLVHVILQDTSQLQQVVDTGVDFWELKGDTAIARAFDIHIEQLRAAGFTVEIIARDASKRDGGNG
jgi:biotin operon repressor